SEAGPRLGMEETGRGMVGQEGSPLTTRSRARCKGSDRGPVRELRALLLAGLHLALLLDAALGRLRPAPGRAALLLRLSVLRLAAGHLLRLVHRALPSADLRPLPLPVSAQHRRSRRPKRGAHMAANRHRQDS